MENVAEKTMADKYAHIKGWGIDADPENEPTYPMKKYTGDDHKRIHWKRPPLQPVNVEVLQSIEHPRMTAVFGTSTPPSGLSGAIRRYAFKYSEGNYVHWFSLILADRINMVEGIIEDVAHGHIPNFFKERGWTAEWKYNRKGMLKNIAITAGVIAGLTLVLYGMNRKSKKSLFS
jgi:hypothetical protein